MRHGPGRGPRPGPRQGGEAVRFNGVLLGLLVLAAGAAIILEARTFPAMGGMDYGPDFFPVLIGAAFCLCGVALIAEAATARSRGPLVVLAPWIREPMPLLRAACVPASIAVYVLAVPVLGFLLTMALIAFGLLAVMGAPWRWSVPVALLMPLALHYGFSVALRVPLPRGPVERLLF